MGAGEPFHFQWGSTGGGEELDGGLGGVVGADGATNDEDGAVGHDHGGGIPAASLQAELPDVLLPVVGAGDAGGSIRPVDAGALERLTGPTADIELTTSLVGEGHASSAEDIGLDVKLTESEGLHIELVDTSLVARAGTTLGDEGDLAGDGLLSDERAVDTVDQVLVLAGTVILREAPAVEGGASPKVGSQTTETTANGRSVASTGDGALSLWAEGSASGSNVGRITAVAFLAVLKTSSGIAELSAPVQTHVRRHDAREEKLPGEGALVVDVVLNAALVLPRAVETADLGSRRLVDLRFALGDDVHAVTGTALLGRVAGTVHAALRLGSGHAAIEDGIAAKALLSVLDTADLVAASHAAARALALAVSGAVDELNGENAALSTIDPASLIAPAFGKTSDDKRRRGRGWRSGGGCAGGNGSAVPGINRQTVAGAAIVEGVAGAEHAAFTGRGHNGADSEAVAAVALPAIFGSEVGVGRAEGLAGLEGHIVGSIGGTAQGTRAGRLGVASIPDVVISDRGGL